MSNLPNAPGNDQLPDGFIPSDIADLSDEEVRLLRHIMRNAGISRDQLKHEHEHFLPDSKTEDIEAMLDHLLQTGHLVRTEGDVTYRVRMRRKPKRDVSMGGIWNALDSGDQDTVESQINPEMRRARSALADNILGKLGTPAQDGEEEQEDDEETQRNTSSLMSDLMSTGRRSMERNSNRAFSSEKQKSDQQQHKNNSGFDTLWDGMRSDDNQ